MNFWFLSFWGWWSGGWGGEEEKKSSEDSVFILGPNCDQTIVIVDSIGKHLIGKSRVKRRLPGTCLMPLRKRFLSRRETGLICLQSYGTVPISFVMS